MANVTDLTAASVHGTNPQFLVEKITRQKVYNSLYWKERCFGRTAEGLVDLAVELRYIGGSYGGNLRPSKFLCLVLKLLQLAPEIEIIQAFVRNAEHKYLRALGAFYLRLVGRHVQIYSDLEPLYTDRRKLNYRNAQSWDQLYMDEFVDKLLREDIACDIALPRLAPRHHLEELGVMPPRKSAILHLLTAPAAAPEPAKTAAVTFDDDEGDEDGDSGEDGPETRGKGSGARNDGARVPVVPQALPAWVDMGGTVAAAVPVEEPRVPAKKAKKGKQGKETKDVKDATASEAGPRLEGGVPEMAPEEGAVAAEPEAEADESRLKKDKPKKKKKKKDKKTKSYSHLFKAPRQPTLEEMEAESREAREQDRYGPGSGGGAGDRASKESAPVAEQKRDGAEDVPLPSAPLEKFSVEWWNVERAKLGLKALREGPK